MGGGLPVSVTAALRKQRREYQESKAARTRQAQVTKEILFKTPRVEVEYSPRMDKAMAFITMLNFPPPPKKTILIIQVRLGEALLFSQRHRAKKDRGRSLSLRTTHSVSYAVESAELVCIR